MADSQNRESVMLPLLACDQLLTAALRAVLRDPQLFDEFGALILSENTAGETRAFHYLFIPTDCPAVGTNNRGVGFRLRDREERLRYAHECGLARRADHGSEEVLQGHETRSLV